MKPIQSTKGYLKRRSDLFFQEDKLFRNTQVREHKQKANLKHDVTKHDVISSKQ